MLPDPDPTSHSSSPGRGASAARVTARIICLVSWPSWAKASSGKTVSTRSSGRYRTATTLSGSTSAGGVGRPSRRAIPSRRRSAGPPSCSRTVNSESPRPVSVSSRASAAGPDASRDSTIARPPRRTAVSGSAVTRLITSVSWPTTPAGRTPASRSTRAAAPSPARRRTAGPVSRRCRAASGHRRRARARRRRPYRRTVAQPGQQRRRPRPAFERSRRRRAVRVGAASRRSRWRGRNSARAAAASPAMPSAPIPTTTITADAHRGILRHMACGTNRVAKTSGRIAQGTQTARLPLASACAVASATCAGRAGQRRRVHPCGHPADDETGPDDQQMHPGAVQCVGQPAGETVQAGLGRAVDVVGAADPGRPRPRRTPRCGRGRAARMRCASRVSRLTWAT